MLADAKIIAFVGTQSPEAARGFYQDTLGLELVADEQFALVFNANGTMLRISKVDKLAPAPFTVLGWEVGDIKNKIDELTARGVTFEHLEGFGQDERGILTFPDGTQVAWFKDPDGNTLSLTQFER